MTQYKHCNIDVSPIIILQFGAIRCETSSKEVLLQYGGESINVPVLRVVAGLMGEGLSLLGHFLALHKQDARSY